MNADKLVLDGHTAIIPAAQTHSKRKKKRKHRDLHDNEASSLTLVDNKPAQTPALFNQETQLEERQSKKSKKNNNKLSSWRISDSIGGFFEDLLPIFSPDEKHLLLAQRHGIKVYSTKTSILVRTCRTGDGRVASFCLSSTSNKLYVLLQDGKVQSWDWLNGVKLKSWDLGAQVSDIAVAAVDQAGSATDIIFTTEFRKGAGSITAHMLESEHPAAKNLYRSKDIIRAIKILNHGEFIVVTTASSIIVGKRISTNAAKKFQHLDYSFDVLHTQEMIICFDARIVVPEMDKKSSSALDLAVGFENGMIVTYYSVEPRKTNEQQPTPLNQKHHWHRDAVDSVAWAPDGNYLLSGGRETVLVMWQLDTGLQTTLPHLTSSIESIVVSPSRTSYVVRLADNSVMILATADLVPTFHTATTGLPSRSLLEDKSLAAVLPQRRAPIICAASQPPRLLVATSSDVYRRKHRSGSYSNTNLISTPLSSMTTTVLRQALVDSNATTIRRRPDGKDLVAPNVVLLEISKDAHWLAAVDEWYAPIEDLEPSSIDQDEALTRRLATAEINLVFWQWDEKRETWDRSTRIPNPHADQEGTTQSARFVLDLVAAPNRNSFWTLGTDGLAKEWVLRKRGTIGSRATTGVTGPETIWRCARSVSIPYHDRRIAGKVDSARLVISKDDSVFGITTTTSAGSEIVIVTPQKDDTTKAILSIQSPQQRLIVSLLNQYLIMADRESLIVRNLVNTTEWYQVKWTSNVIASETPTQPLMATDQERQLFAVSIPRRSKRTNAARSKQSKIMIFSPLSDIPVAVLDHQPSTAALLVVHGKFYAITTEAEVYSFSPNPAQDLESNMTNTTAASKDEASHLAPQTNSLSNIFGSDKLKTAAADKSEIMTINETATRKDVPWEDLPGLDLSKPFALPKTSTIQMMTAMAIRA